MTDAHDQALFTIVLEIFQAGVKCGINNDTAAYPMLRPSIVKLTELVDERINETKAQVRSGFRPVVIENGEMRVIPEDRLSRDMDDYGPEVESDS